MKIIYLLIILFLSAVGCASNAYILADKTLSTSEFCMFACFASTDLLIFCWAAANLAREI
jgi:hypothetical protein